MRIHPPTQPMACASSQPNWVTYQQTQGIHTTRIPIHELGSVCSTQSPAAYLILKTSWVRRQDTSTMSSYCKGTWTRIPWVLLKPLLSLGLRKESELPPVPFGVMVRIHSTTTAFFNNPAYIPLMKMKSFYSYGTTYIFVWHLNLYVIATESWWVSWKLPQVINH